MKCFNKVVLCAASIICIFVDTLASDLPQKTTDMQSDIMHLKSDVSQMKSDITQVKADVTEMKSLFTIMVGTMQMQLQASLQSQQNQTMVMPPYYIQPTQSVNPYQDQQGL